MGADAAAAAAFQEAVVNAADARYMIERENLLCVCYLFCFAKSGGELLGF